MDYVLIPGAGGRAWYWHLVEPRLTSQGHRVFTVELPADDDTMGLADYVRAALATGSAARGGVVVAASLGAFTAPMVAEALDARAVVLVNPMVPLPGETPGEWWGATGAIAARTAHSAQHGYPRELDPGVHLFHDVPREILATATPKGEQSTRPFGDPCTFSAWPAAVTVVTGRDDRFFPLDFQRELARARLHVEPVVVTGGHLAALSRPGAIASAILDGT